MERGQRGGGREGGEELDFTDGYDEMSGWIYGMFGWNEAKFFSDFVHPCNATGTPASGNTNKTGDCLSVCLICSAMGG